LTFFLVVGNRDMLCYFMKSYSIEFLLKQKTVIGDYYKKHAYLRYSALQARHSYYCYATVLHTTQNTTLQCI